MVGVTIRQETESDRPVVFELVRAAFEHAEHADHDEHLLVEKLRVSPEFVPELSLVAVHGGGLVGHILFTEMRVSGQTLLLLAILSVLPAWQRMGVGAQLIAAGHDAAKNLGYTAAVLIGHAAYYPRFGYKRASGFGLIAPIDVPDEAFMAIELTPCALVGINGVIETPVAFVEKLG